MTKIFLSRLTHLYTFSRSGKGGSFLVDEFLACFTENCPSSRILDMNNKNIFYCQWRFATTQTKMQLF